jgi:hypothetical protein
VALSRLAYRADTGTITYQSDKASGPTAGAETVDALEFLARVVSHIPNKGQVLQRYYGWYANRTRGSRRRACTAEPPPVPQAEAVAPALHEARRRWAELLRRIFAVDPLRCPRCGAAMRILGFLTQPPVIDRILGSGVLGPHAGWLGAPLGPDPDPARAGGRPTGPRDPGASTGSTPPLSLAAASLDGPFTQPYFGRAD